MAANDKQIAGEHYKQFKNFEPWDVIEAWGLGYLDGNALKYISRWRHKDGVRDLQKAVHYLEKLIEQKKEQYNKNLAHWVEVDPSAKGNNDFSGPDKNNFVKTSWVNLFSPYHHEK